MSFYKEESLTNRQSYVTRHRQELDRIKTDSVHNRVYSVPVTYSEIDGKSQGDDDDSSRSHVGVFQGYLNKLQASAANYVQGKTTSDWVGTFLPCWRWLKDYRGRANLASDWIAGLSVGVMVIPQGMSYAKLAGMPVQFGLYSALVPVYAYAVFGTSRQLAVGPVAIVSLLLSSCLSTVMDSKGIPTTDPNYQKIYNGLAIQTTFLVGIVNLILGFCRLGFITIFLSKAVMSGFTTGASVIIAVSQLKYVVGYDIPRSDLLQENIKYFFQGIKQFNVKTFFMSTCAIALLMFLKWVSKTYKRFWYAKALGPLTVTIIGVILSVSLNLQTKGFAVVGTIPRGFPSASVSAWTPISDFHLLIVPIISIVIVGFMESISIAKQLAAKHKYEVDSSDELIGLGFANFFGAMFQSYPVTGSFSRSAVNNESGAKSGIAGFVTATLVALVLLFLTPIFQKLPMAILAAIVISGVITLMDFDEAIYLFKVHKFDCFVWVIAFILTMFAGVEIGLGVAVAVSILLVIYEAAFPHTAVLGRLPGTSVYRNIKQYPEAERVDGVLLVRVDAPLFFANAQNVRDKIRKYRLLAEEDLAVRNAGHLKYLIIELTPVSHIDTTAMHIFEDMHENHKSRGQQICFCNPSLLVMKRMIASGFADKVGREHFFSSAHDAIGWCLNELDNEALSVHEGDVGIDKDDDNDSYMDKSERVDKEEAV